MNNRNLLVFELNELFQILVELSDYLNFNIFEISKSEIKDLEKKYFSNYLVIANKNLDQKKQIIIDDKPIKIKRLIERINIEFIKQEYTEFSNINIGSYTIDLNSRLICNDKFSLKLTEKEINSILFLSKNKKPVSIKELQLNVWGYKSQLETHTVETHIYRLRKKILNIFNDQNFISSSINGYEISQKK